MKVIATGHPEVLLVEPDFFGDERGFFMESYHAEKYPQHGLPGTFVQDNHSRSARGVLRGLHYQLEHPQGKLVRVVSGEVFDVAVDIRKGSPRFGKAVSVVLSADEPRQLYIPPGFAHGFCTLSEDADLLYKCTELYAPGDEYGIAWDDPDIAIDWPRMEFSFSEKDKHHPRLRDSDSLPDYEAA